jgi:hypothetical protein
VLLAHVMQIEPFKQRDWEAKRRESDLQDVIKAGSKLGAQAEVIQVRPGYTIWWLLLIAVSRTKVERHEFAVIGWCT